VTKSGANKIGWGEVHGFTIERRGIMTTQDLTSRQQRFVDLYIMSGNATQAYIEAGFSPKGASGHAARLVANGSVAAEIARRRTDAATKADLTVAGHLEELCRLRELAKASKQYAAAIQAEIKRGEAAGFYVKRRENIKPTMSREQLAASVCALLRISPEQLRVMQASGPTLGVLSEAGSKP
jgi:hypothetical protein